MYDHSMAEKPINNQTHKKNVRMDLQLHSLLTSKTRSLKVVSFGTGCLTDREINLWAQDDGTDAKAKRKIPVPTENRTSVKYVQSSVLVNTPPESLLPLRKQRQSGQLLHNNPI